MREFYRASVDATVMAIYTIYVHSLNKKINEKNKNKITKLTMHFQIRGRINKEFKRECISIFIQVTPRNKQ